MTAKCDVHDETGPRQAARGRAQAWGRIEMQLNIGPGVVRVGQCEHFSVRLRP